MISQEQIYAKFQQRVLDEMDYLLSLKRLERKGRFIFPLNSRSCVARLAEIPRADFKTYEVHIFDTHYKKPILDIAEQIAEDFRRAPHYESGDTLANKIKHAFLFILGRALSQQYA